MTKSRRDYETQCMGKKRYEGPVEARKGSGVFSKRKREKQWLSYYCCGWCGYWHIGHLPKKPRKFERDDAA